RACSSSAALQRYGVKNKLKMLMYHEYIPLFRLFSPCLALARETLNRLLDPFTKTLILRCASLSYDLYCLRRRALAQVRGAVLLAALRACSKSSEQERDKAKTAEKAECTSGT
ncbi:hypothetical protein, partial [Chromobacterium haemolyticum]|uniref:hypothetical protein n=1 Tax=Chromobacterium haemolyticum TaxID=394935 RepID=UPI002448E138